MKSRLTLIFAALVVLLGAMLWVMHDRRDNAGGPVIASEQALTVRSEPAGVQSTVLPVVPLPAPPLPTRTPEPKPQPMVHVSTSGDVNYVARDGDTISQLAIALLGSDSKEHRDSVVAANPSLQPNADRVLTGQNYTIVRASEATGSSDPTSPASPPANAPVGRTLKYVAQPGDTVGVLAANLLGGDTKANRATIVGSNTSLQQDPDHLVAGQTYTIAAPNGLAAAPDAKAGAARTSEPDADDAARLGVGRVLRYTAQAGDSVSKLAIVLLGSDTPANRDLIFQSNVGLRENPDRLIAGRTYWIVAPTEAAAGSK